MRDYPIGSQGKPWTDTDKKTWLQAQEIKRSYADEVLSKYSEVSERFRKTQYGALAIDESRYPLFAFTSTPWDANKANVLVSGGVHGYETSGVLGALEFLLTESEKYLSHFNIIVVPCISPWGYETINRWTYNTNDPNRSFYANSPSPEAQQLMEFVQGFMAKQKQQIDVHFDLHETTDTDNSEFRPALAARDGEDLDEWEIPDGFYTVANTTNPQIDFQNAVIASVEKVTHIAPSDANGKIIGTDVLAPGVICYDKKSLFLCGGFTNASYVTTTEVYPDSPKATQEICIRAQVAAISGGLDFLIAHKITF